MSASEKDIERLKRKIEEKMNWGAASFWHSKMFDKLSEEVFRSTQVALSVTTLKRVLGVVKHEGSPSVTTLDALAAFLGEENWTNFKTKQPIKRRWIKAPSKTTYLVIGFVLAMITIGLLSNRRPDLVINASEFEFSSKVLSTEFPNSVVFDFFIPEDIVADSFKIQQYWDPTKTVDIDKDQSQATAIYYRPGYYEAKLLVNGQPAKTHDLFLKSDGWLGQIEYEPVPKYFDPIVNGTAISMPENITDEVAGRDQPIMSSFHYVDDLGSISGDYFSFQATVRNTFDDRWAVCQSVSIFFLGTTGAIIVPFSKVGCSSDLNLMLNDQFFSGKENDLSALTADFSNPTGLRILVREKKFSTFINDQLVYENQYYESLGKLVGVRVKFQGAGEILDHALYNELDELVLLN